MPSKALVSIYAICALPFVQAAATSEISPGRTESIRTDGLGSRVAQLTRSQFEEPLIATARTTREEDDALLRAVSAYSRQGNSENLQAFQKFLADHPRSGWRVALLTNLGLSYYHHGYFSKALSAWQMGWDEGKPVTEPHAKTLVDRAFGELIRMHARVGHAEALAALLKDLGDRHVTGPATEALSGARQGLWEMQNAPGDAYLCGPSALKNLILSEDHDYSRVKFIDDYRSGPNGVTLAQVSQLADQARLPHRLVFRAGDQPIPVPSVVHWKISHFAAIVGRNGDRYRIQDPTFGSQDIWISRAAVDAESSGYFLVPGQDSRSLWRDVSASEAENVRGMGYTASNFPLATTPQDFTCLCLTVADNASNVSTAIRQWGGMSTPDSVGPPLTQYDMTEMVVSLKLSDTPVGYTPPVGPAVHLTVTYNQREANQPANFSYFNVSAKWTLNWLTYIMDDPKTPGGTVSRYVAGGGGVNYMGYSAATGTFTPETKDASVLALVSASPITYHRNLADGSVEIYSQSNGATTAPRKIFLTQVSDPAGNSVTLNYDNQLRLTSIKDAIGQTTTFSYELAAKPLLATRITDPFKRSAALSYDASGRLSQITDVLGLVSQFFYDASSEVNMLTTPYGTTHFSYGDTVAGDKNARFLQVTDPLGYTERLEFRQEAPGIASGDPNATVPNLPGRLSTGLLEYRDTFYWDKHAFALAAGDYTKARQTQWYHYNPSRNMTSPTVEDLKYPLENRIWFTYPGQPAEIYTGTLDKPNGMGRVLDDGSSQIIQFAYNALGHVADMIDPVGRETQLTYEPNNIDLMQVKQKTSASAFSTLAAFTYNTPHFPHTYTDAAGQTTTFTYNQAGQETSITNALNYKTQFMYDASGYLKQIINADGKTSAQFTYDAFGRVAARTDSEGYVLQFKYDAADRLTLITYPDGTSRQYTWKNLDLVAITDRQGRVTQYAYDAVRNLIGITDPLGQQTKLGYYENGKLKSLTDADGNTTTWAIDLQSRVIGKQYQDGKSDTFAFENTTSRLKSKTDALAQVKQYSYTLDDQLAGIDYAKAVNPTPSVRFTYDPYFQRVVSMVDGTGTTGYAYEPVGSLGALGLLSESSSYLSSAITYQYDALARITGRNADGNSESFAFDPIGRLMSHTSPLGVFDYLYLGETGQVASRKLRGGTVSTAYTYDANTNDRRLTSIANSGATRSYGYMTTPEYLIKQIAESAPSGSAWRPQTWNYNYDNNDRLQQAQSSNGALYAYGYDPADNITSLQMAAETVSPSYNADNQITAFAGRSFIYDANGNLTDDGQRTYQWDAENRLVAVASKTSPTQVTSFVYDGLSRRVASLAGAGAKAPIKISAFPDFLRAPHPITVSRSMTYIWCGDTLCGSQGPGGSGHSYYPEGEYIAGVGTSLYYQQDHLGSVRDVVSGSTGRRVASFDYDPYGNPVQTGGTVSTDFRYAGMFYDQQDGLYLTKYRAYSPALGRWLSRDLIGVAGGLNVYEYVNGNPMRGADRNGLWGAFQPMPIGGSGPSANPSVRAGSPISPQTVQNVLDWLRNHFPDFGGSTDRINSVVDTASNVGTAVTLCPAGIGQAVRHYKNPAATYDPVGDPGGWQTLPVDPDTSSWQSRFNKWFQQQQQKGVTPN